MGLVRLVLAGALLCWGAWGQDAASGPAADPVDKRIFGVLPNYRTTNETPDYEPITSRQKLTIASKDSFDWPMYLLSGAYAGLFQLENQNPSFGQGMAGYGRRFAGSLGDQISGNLLTEGFLPVLFREDPRYFRRGHGGFGHRLAYSATRIFVTRTDAGGRRFNFSEFVGNAGAVAMSNAWYPETRTVSDNLQKYGMQLGTDAVANVMKEFWPDVKRRLFRRRAEP